MYPIFRLVKEYVKFRDATPIDFLEVHESSHICWPWDLDIWMELNNGRTMTIMDLGRIIMFGRHGIHHANNENGWRVTMAGCRVRYRRRIPVWAKLKLKSRIIGWDNKFFYAEQAIWNSAGDCATHAIYRVAVTTGRGLIPPARVVEAMGKDSQSPQLPSWVQDWIAAEDQCPWPPMSDL